MTAGESQIEPQTNRPRSLGPKFCRPARREARLLRGLLGVNPLIEQQFGTFLVRFGGRAECWPDLVNP